MTIDPDILRRKLEHIQEQSGRIYTNSQEMDFTHSSQLAPMLQWMIGRSLQHTVWSGIAIADP